MINNLAAFRKRAGMNQKEFSKKLGIGTVTLSKWENPDFNLKELSIAKIVLICEILNIGFWDLIDKEKK